MTKQRFDYLIQRYKDNILSAEEREELKNAFEAGDQQHFFAADIRAEFDSFTTHTNWDADAERRVWSSIQAAGSPKPSGRHGKARIIRMAWVRWSAAAMVILLAGSIYLYLAGKRVRPTAPEAPVATVIPPGTNKAVLTLGGGERVILNDTKEGNIAKQGGVSILKVDSGLLAYHGGVKTGDEAAEVVNNTITTPRGGQYQLILQDGTHVWLNAASSITFPTAFSGKERRVWLKGEGYFEVRHDAARPFRVSSAGQEVEVIGTSFNINCYSDEQGSKTTLIEGAVKVVPGVAGAGKIPVLRPGQQLRQEQGKILALTDDVDIEQVIAWKNGQLSLVNTDFQTLMRQISRWYDVDVRYAGKVPQKRFFAMLNRNVNLSTVLEFMRQNGILIQQNGRELTVQPL